MCIKKIIFTRESMIEKHLYQRTIEKKGKKIKVW